MLGPRHDLHWICCNGDQSIGPSSSASSTRLSKVLRMGDVSYMPPLRIWILASTLDNVAILCLLLPAMLTNGRQQSF